MNYGNLDNLPLGRKEKKTWPWTVDKSTLNRAVANKKYWPRISIVTPSFNQGRFLEQAIRSVLLQGYPNLEYIIIDGGSSDNSVEVIKKYENFLAYWVSEPDSGHGNALNKGFSHATGEIMAWLNSDDMYAPSAFFTAAEIFDGFRDIQWITGINSWWDMNDEQTSTSYVYKNIYDFLIGRYAWIQQESSFWRRPLWKRAGGRINEKYQFMVDGELWCRFFLLTELWHVDAVLGGYRLHTSNKAEKNKKEVRKEMETAISELNNNCSEQARQKAKRLKYIKILTLNIDRIFQKAVEGFYKEAAYKKLVYKNGDWVKAVSALKQ